MTEFPTCLRCGESFTTPEGLQQHVVSCASSPAKTGKRKPEGGPR